MNLCIDCKHFRNTTLNHDIYDRCAGFDDEITSYIDPLDGTTKYRSVRGWGAQTEPKWTRPFCRRINHSGDCSRFEKKPAEKPKLVKKPKPSGLWAWIQGYR